MLLKFPIPLRKLTKDEVDLLELIEEQSLPTRWKNCLHGSVLTIFEVLQQDHCIHETYFTDLGTVFKTTAYGKACLNYTYKK